MASISIIPLSKLKSNRRLDAQYYRPSNIAFDAILSGVPTVKLGNVASITDGIHTSIQFDETSNILLISAMSPKQNYFELSKSRHIDKVQHSKNPRTSLRTNDVIVSSVGTIGNAAVVDEDMLPANSDRHVGIVRLKNTFLPRYLSTFLLSKYGHYQTLREATGNVQLNLFIDKMGLLIIPKATQRLQSTIEDAVLEANTLRSQAYQNYRQAITDLENRLGLSALTMNTANISIRSLHEPIGSGRFDAEYWLPRYDDHLRQVQKTENVRLEQIVTYKKGVEVGSEKYSETGVSFVRVADFSPFGIEPIIEKKIDDELYAELIKNTPQAGEILLTKDGTIGMSHVLKETPKCILSGAFLRLTPIVEIEAEYLSLILNSSVGQMQMKRLTGGAIIAHLKPEDAMSIYIPILDKSYQQAVASHMRSIFDDLRKARSIFNACVDSIEQYVEAGEDQAMQILGTIRK